MPDHIHGHTGKFFVSYKKHLHSRMTGDKLFRYQLLLFRFDFYIDLKQI